jgi:uncharacterized protein
MDILIISVGVFFLLIGLIGCILPIVPGPPLAYVSFLTLLFHSASKVHPSSIVLLSFGVAVAAITALDYYLPIWGTKKFGGTNAGKRGSIVGLIAAFFMPIAGPFTIFIGPLIGAIVGEMLAGNDRKTALNSGIGSFLGFMAGTLLKFGIVGMIIWKFVKLVWF